MSILGQVLFTIFINGIDDEMVHSADYTKLSVGREYEEGRDAIQSGLDEKWDHENKMRLNNGKWEVLDNTNWRRIH